MWKCSIAVSCLLAHLVVVEVILFTEERLLGQCSHCTDLINHLAHNLQWLKSTIQTTASTALGTWRHYCTNWRHHCSPCLPRWWHAGRHGRIPSWGGSEWRSDQGGRAAHRTRREPASNQTRSWRPGTARHTRRRLSEPSGTLSLPTHINRWYNSLHIISYHVALVHNHAYYDDNRYLIE